MATSVFSIPKAYLQATALQQQGQIQQAAALWQRILKADPKNVPSALAFARLLYRHGEAHHAKTVLERSQSYARSNFEYCYLMGALQHHCGDFSAAQQSMLHACELNTDSAEAFNVLGSIYIELGQYAEAISSFQQSIAIQPTLADPHNNIAWAYRSLGEPLRAIEHFEQAFKLNPSATEALSGLLMLKRYTAPAPEMQVVEQLLERPDLSRKQRTELAFALGKAYEDLQDYHQAFHCFEKGNVAWRKGLNYHIKQDIALFKQLTSNFPLGNKAPSPSTTNHTVTPVFILGMPRSSTSLIEQILASHSQVTGAGELGFLASRLLNNKGEFIWQHIDPPALADEYLQSISKLSEGKPFVCDKMPQNFRFIGAILECIPNAKIIHCQRNALDTCLSLYKHHFPMTNHGYAYDLQELGQYYQLYEELMAHWRQWAPGAFYELEYEQLIENFEPELRRLLGFIGLDFEPACLNFQDTSRVIRTASSEQVRRGLYKTGAGQWRHYEQQLAGLRARLDASKPSSTSPPSYS